MNIKALISAAVLGLVVLAAGLVVGLMPTTVEGVSCGSAFAPNEDDAYIADLGSTLVGGTGSGDVRTQCADQVSGMRVPAVALIVAGGLVATSAGIAAGAAGARQRQMSPTNTG